MIERFAPTILAFLLAGSSLALTACHGDEEASDPPVVEQETQEATQEETTAPAEETEEPAVTVEDRQIAASEVFNTRVRLGLEPPPDLVVSDLLTRADIRELVHYEGTLADTTLAGIPAGPNYNALRIASETGYGVGLQLWMTDEARQAVPRFRRLRDTYFEAQEDESPVGDAAFYGNVEGIRHYAFVHRSSRSVVVITCEVALCSEDQVRTLADRVLSRL